MTTELVSAHQGHQLVGGYSVSLGPFPTLFVKLKLVFFSGLEAKKKDASLRLDL